MRRRLVSATFPLPSTMTRRSLLLCPSCSLTRRVRYSLCVRISHRFAAYLTVDHMNNILVNTSGDYLTVDAMQELAEEAGYLSLGEAQQLVNTKGGRLASRSRPVASPPAVARSPQHATATPPTPSRSHPHPRALRPRRLPHRGGHAGVGAGGWVHNGGGDASAGRQGVTPCLAARRENCPAPPRQRVNLAWTRKCNHSACYAREAITRWQTAATQRRPRVY